MTTYLESTKNGRLDTLAPKSPYSVPPLEGVDDLKIDESRKRRFSVSSEDSSKNKEIESENFEKKVHPKSKQVQIRLENAVKHLFFWKDLLKEHQKILIDAMFEKKCKKGDVIVQQGDVGDNFYVIENGIFTVLKSPNIKNKKLQFKKVYEYNNKGSFGELALLYNCRRQATVCCVSDTGILWCVDSQTFRYIMIKSNLNKRQKFNTFLSNHILFKHLNEERIFEIADTLNVVEYEKNNIVIKQNEDNEDKKFYLIQHGTLNVYINGKKVNQLVENDFFGERAIIFNQERSATVKVISNRARLFYITNDQFSRLVDLFYDKIKPFMKKYIIDSDELNDRLKE